MLKGECRLYEFQKFLYHALVIAEDIISAEEFEPLPVVVAGIGELKRHKQCVKEESKHRRVAVRTDVTALSGGLDEVSVSRSGEAFDLGREFSRAIVSGQPRDLIVEFYVL